MSVWQGRAPGKVNECLFVGRRRSDGLHLLVSVIQPLSLADELTLRPASVAAGPDEVVCPGVEGPNLAERALAAYRAESGWRGPAQRLEIDKRVPVAAGMGGGSADAAGALRLLSLAAGRPADPVAAAVAPRLGSDVPAQLLARRCLISGAGERVEALGARPPGAVLVLPSTEELSTARVYGTFDALGAGRSDAELADLAERIRAAEARGGLPDELRHNDLAAAALEACPSIAGHLEDARAAGADRAMVSGSGPTVVGFFDGPEGLRRAAAARDRLGAGHPRAVVAERVDERFAAPRPA